MSQEPVVQLELAGVPARLAKTAREFSLAGKPLRLAHFLELQELCRVIAADGGEASLAVTVDQPVWVGSLRLYRPSLAALAYLQSLPGLFPESLRRELGAAWLCAHGRDREALLAFARPETATAALDAWLRTVDVHLEELLAASAAAMAGFPLVAGPMPGEAVAEGGTLGYLAVAALLAKAAGSGDVDYWLWDQSAQRAYWIARSLRPAREGETPPGRLEAQKAYRVRRAELRIAYGLDPEVTNG